jgi:hypothetical protein
MRRRDMKGDIEMRILLTAAGACALFASTVAAAEPDRIPAPEQQPAQARQSEERRAQPRRLICRRIESSGTRLGAQRVCMTREGWQRARNLT